jgi:hypothetical protein
MRPDANQQLALTGFIACNDGRRTLISVLLAHVIDGNILGGAYRRR